MASSRRTVSTDVNRPLFLLPAPQVYTSEFIPQPAGTPQSDPLRKDIFNGRLLKDLTLVHPYQIPQIDPCLAIPEKLVSFTEAMGRHAPDPTAWVHFYEDDYKFERWWKHPEKYFEHLSGFGGIISPDFSLYANMPAAQQIANTYKNYLLGAWAQHRGLPVIANVRLTTAQSISYALAGSPRHSTIALGLHGCIKDKDNRRQVMEEMRVICDFLDPAHILIYGSEAYGVATPALERGIPVHVYKPDSWTRSRERVAA